MHGKDASLNATKLLQSLICQTWGLGAAGFSQIKTRMLFWIAAPNNRRVAHPFNARLEFCIGSGDKSGSVDSVKYHVNILSFIENIILPLSK